MAAEDQTARFAIHSEDSDVVAALIAGKGVGRSGRN
jgi:hypothetical protein